MKAVTGNADLLLQDCHYKLFAWFAQRVDARWTVRQVCAAIRRGGDHG